MSAKGLLVGVDIGGTFTDFVLLDEATAELRLGKRLTTPDDPSRAVVDGLRELLAFAGREASEVKAIVHGTTLATNAIIQRTGARTALITTRGFRDALEIRREKRVSIHDVTADAPEPLIPRALRFEVDERLMADGTVRQALDEASVATIVQALAAQEIESVAVALLHSFMNDAHERRVRDLLLEADDGLFVSLSSEINPEIREYQRTSTTAVNAYVQPIMTRYLGTLSGELEALGYRGQLYMMLSDGGVSTAEVAAREPVRIIESGPAGGAMAAAFLGRSLGHPNVIAFDMGGTTAKICLIEDAEPTRANESEVARLQWWERGSGYPLRAPSIEMIEIGTGGGSLARVGAAGLVRVGPRSAGAAPGPACYGRGGREPTVTDADLVLGYLNPDYFLGGRMALDVAAAERAIDEAIAEPLGLSRVEAAWAIHEIANEQMAVSARLHVVQRGGDPGDYVMCAFGGAGPIHAGRIAERLGAPSIVYPQGAGVASALGFLVAPLSIGLTRGYSTLVRDLDTGVLERLFAEMDEQAGSLLRRAGVDERDIRVTRHAALCYDGQGFELDLPIPDGFPVSAGADALAAGFHARYAELYGRAESDLDVKALTWRTVATGPASSLVGAGLHVHGGNGATRDADGALKGTRPVFFPELGGYAQCPVYDRAVLGESERIDGPAILEEAESTVVLTPSMHATVVGPDALVATLDLGMKSHTTKEHHDGAVESI